jgi:hypothetical protein
MKRLLLASSLVLSTATFAATNIPLEQQISSFTVVEVTTPANLHKMTMMGLDGGANGGGTTGGVTGGGTTTPEIPPKPTFDDRLDKTGRVIQTARDLVALGEAFYELVKKGRPSNVTEFAPISVVPRNAETKEYVDPFDLEGFSMPVERSFIAKVKNGTGSEVVNFNYKVLYSFGGSYDGKGKYLTNVMVVPGAVRTSYGWDFNAKMTLSGVMNHGTRANPVAGAMVTIKYQMNSWSAAFERNDTIHVTGAGEMKNFMAQ